MNNGAKFGVSIAKPNANNKIRATKPGVLKFTLLGVILPSVVALFDAKSLSSLLKTADSYK